MTTKKFSFLNIIYFLIAFLILFLAGYIIYDNFIKIDSVTINPTNETLTQDQIEIMGKGKFNWLNSQLKVENNSNIFFTNVNLDATNFTNNDILTIAYNNMETDDRNGTGNTDNSCFNKSISDYPENCYKETFDKSVMQEQIDKYFSSTLSVTYANFNPSGSKTCQITSNTYTCILSMGKIDLANVLTINGYDHSAIENDHLVVYSKLLTIKRKLDIYKESEQGIYSDIDATNKIDDLSYYNEITTNGLNNEAENNLIAKYKDQITTYKTTFVKNSTNNYVWLSTEIIK